MINRKCLREGEQTMMKRGKKNQREANEEEETVE